MTNLVDAGAVELLQQFTEVMEKVEGRLERVESQLGEMSAGWNRTLRVWARIERRNREEDRLIEENKKKLSI